MLSDLLSAARIWWGLMMNPPLSWLWVAVAPGFLRGLRRFKGVRHVGPSILRFLDSPWAVRCERYSRVLLVLFVAGTALAAPLILLQNERAVWLGERKTLLNQIGDL